MNSSKKYLFIAVVAVAVVCAVGRALASTCDSTDYKCGDGEWMSCGSGGNCLEVNCITNSATCTG